MIAPSARRSMEAREVRKRTGRKGAWVVDRLSAGVSVIRCQKASAWGTSIRPLAVCCKRERVWRRNFHAGRLRLPCERRGGRLLDGKAHRLNVNRRPRLHRYVVIARLHLGNL